MRVRRIPHFWTGAILLVLLIAAIYSNTLNASWHLDDYPNIVNNTFVQFKSLDAFPLRANFSTDIPHESLKRPVAYFTFGLNWLWSGDDVTSYHVVNIAIHMLASIFLFLCTLKLFSAPNIKAEDNNTLFFIALFSSVLWSIHPIQTQAVTYIVQRMASLAALFYILSIWFYLKGRLTPNHRKSSLFYAGCLFTFILALGTKQNTITLPIILLLIEIIFFQDLRIRLSLAKILSLLALCCAILAIIVSWLLFSGNELNSMLSGYMIRPFTPFERLLTQSRVVVFYLSQLAYPIPSRFSITHDFTISASLFSPWPTLPSVLFISACLFFSFRLTKKAPFFSFAILFYFINHSIESGILPLEMVFEHRNYLPSFFLFVPVSIGFKKLLDHYRMQNIFLYKFLNIAACMLIVGISTSTYIRNMDWRTEKTLWEDAAAKAPNSARPLQNLAWAYYSPAGQTEKAISLYQRALNLSDDTIGHKAISYYNLSGIYFSKLKDYDKAIYYAQKAADDFPGYFHRASFLLASSRANSGNYDEALKILDNLIREKPGADNYLYLKGLILLKLNKPETALEYFRQCIRIAPNKWNYLREIGFCFTLMHQPDRARFFLRQAERINPNQPEILLCLADCYFKSDQASRAKDYINRLLRVVEIDEMDSFFSSKMDVYTNFAYVYKDILPLISNHLYTVSKRYDEMALHLEKNDRGH